MVCARASDRSHWTSIGGGIQPKGDLSEKEPGKQLPWPHSPPSLSSSARALLAEPKGESEVMGACWCDLYRSVSWGREQGRERERVDLEGQMEDIWHRTYLLNYEVLDVVDSVLCHQNHLNWSLCSPRWRQCCWLTACSWVPLQDLPLHFRPFFPKVLPLCPRTAYIYDWSIKVQPPCPNSRQFRRTIFTAEVPTGWAEAFVAIALCFNFPSVQYCFLPFSIVVDPEGTTLNADLQLWFWFLGNLWHMAIYHYYWHVCNRIWATAVSPALHFSYSLYRLYKVVWEHLVKQVEWELKSTLYHTPYIVWHGCLFLIYKFLYRVLQPWL